MIGGQLGPGTNALRVPGGVAATMNFAELPAGLQAEVRAWLQDKHWWPALCVTEDSLDAVIAKNLSRQPWKDQLCAIETTLRERMRLQSVSVCEDCAAGQARQHEPDVCSRHTFLHFRPRWDPADAAWPGLAWPGLAWLGLTVVVPCAVSGAARRWRPCSPTAAAL